MLKELIIEGNKRISVETIKVYGDIKINKDYSEEDINKILTGLYSTNFFKNIELDFKNNKLKIRGGVSFSKSNYYFWGR